MAAMGMAFGTVALAEDDPVREPIQSGPQAEGQQDTAAEFGEMQTRRAQMHERYRSASPEEREVMRQQWEQYRAQQHERYMNASPEEQAAMRQAREAHRQALRQRYQDATPEEQQAMRQQMHARDRLHRREHAPRGGGNGPGR